MSIKVYLMAILDNYMFRPLLAIFRLSFYMWWYALTRGMVVLVASVKFEVSGPPVLRYAVRPVCRDLCTTCVLSVYSRTLSSLEDNLKMASKESNVNVLIDEGRAEEE